MEWSHCWLSVAQEHYGDSESCGPVAASGAAKKHGEGGMGFVIRAPEFKNDSFDCR